MKTGRPQLDPTAQWRYKLAANGCWIWKSEHLTHSGFPVVSIASRNVMAARVFYERYVGVILDGYVVYQKCRNRKCVNPEHLELKTSPESHRLAMSVKLTKDDVSKIRAAYTSGERQNVLAKEYGVGQHQISRIVNYKRWKI